MLPGIAICDDQYICSDVEGGTTVVQSSRHLYLLLTHDAVMSLCYNCH